MSVTNNPPIDVESPVSDPSEQLVCPVCCTVNWEAAQRVRAAPLSRCSKCGLLATTHFLKNYATAETLYDVDLANYREYSHHYLAARRMFFGHVLPKLDAFKKNGRLLEVGAGYGHFLECASEAGWDAHGVEISSYACKIARSRGCKVDRTDLFAVQLSPNSYDVITMWDVIEHLPFPTRVIQRCNELLRPGGALVLRTPDGRALCLDGGMMAQGYKHFAYPANTPEHVFHFTPENLTGLVAKSGFEAIKIEAGRDWAEFVVSGRNIFVRAIRWSLLRYAAHAHWPYEFVMFALKPVNS